MNRLTLPGLLAGSFLLVSCSSTTPTVTPAQVAADLTGIVTTLQNIEPLIVAADPAALTAAQQKTLTDDLAYAKAGLATLTAGLPATAGASAASRIDGYVNDVLNTLVFVSSTVPGLQPYAAPIAAIDAVLPEVEAFVNQYLPTSVTNTGARKVAARMAARSAMTPDQGRRELAIPIVHQ
jgi:hypothetical protein